MLYYKCQQQFNTLGGCYDTAKRQNEKPDLNQFFQYFERYCHDYNFSQNSQNSTLEESIKLSFSKNLSIKSPDESTLFCTSGMQSLKPLFSKTNYQNTFCNVQKCLRLNDLDEIGDSTHYLIFHMLGMFSFRQLTVEQTIKFWLDFLTDFNLYPTHVTIHPDKIKDWSIYYPKELEIRPDNECKWSDGNIGGYCTEFYYNEIEIGNIVNPLGNCIDVGFGLERLLNLKYESSIISKNEILTNTVTQLIEEGFTPSSSKQGYVLRKLLNMMIFENIKINHVFYEKIYNDQLNIYKNYLRNKDHKKYKDKTDIWWLDTFGMDIKNISKYKVLKVE